MLAARALRRPSPHDRRGKPARRPGRGRGEREKRPGGSGEGGAEGERREERGREEREGGTQRPPGGPIGPRKIFPTKRSETRLSSLEGRAPHGAGRARVRTRPEGGERERANTGAAPRSAQRGRARRRARGDRAKDRQPAQLRRRPNTRARQLRGGMRLQRRTRVSPWIPCGSACAGGGLPSERGQQKRLMRMISNVGSWRGKPSSLCRSVTAPREAVGGTWWLPPPTPNAHARGARCVAQLQ